MEKIVLAVASFDNEKYYLSEDFGDLPEEIKKELRTICVVLANKLMCTFIIGFYENSDMYFETVKSERILDFDDIGAELEIKKLEMDNKNFIKSLRLWYLIFKTPGGKEIKEDFIKNEKRL